MLYDVVIVGVGLVGLFLFGELVWVGCLVMLLEQVQLFDLFLKCLFFGLCGLNVFMLEVLDWCGLLDVVVVCQVLKLDKGVLLFGMVYWLV